MLIRDANLRRKECLPVRARRGRASDPREECLLVRSTPLLTHHLLALAASSPLAHRQRVPKQSCQRRMMLDELHLRLHDDASRNARYSKQPRKCLCAGDVFFQVLVWDDWKVTQSISPSFPLFLAFLPSSGSGVSAACFGLRRRVWTASADRPGLSPRRSGPGKQNQEEEECSDLDKGHPTTASAGAKTADLSPLKTVFNFPQV